MKIDAKELLEQSKDDSPRAPLVTKHDVCAHFYKEIDELGRVTCRDCQREIDPKQALLEMARRWSDVESQVSRLNRARVKLFDEVADLKRQRRNLTAQVRRTAKPKGSS